jgi:hypothetical protein
MARKVFDLYRREWSLRRSIEWSPPFNEEDQFEHDVDGGRGAVVFILSSLVFLWVVLFIWLPDNIHFPWFYWLALIVILGFFPVRWVLRRQWKIVAETVGAYDQPAERWQGLVRGWTRSNEELRIVKRRLETQGTPGHADSPLQPMN